MTRSAGCVTRAGNRQGRAGGRAGSAVRALLPLGFAWVHALEPFDAALARGSARDLEVMLKHFAHLRLDGEMRRQRGERVLEYERDVAATDLIQFSARYAEHVAALKLHRAGDSRVLSRQTERGQERLTLAGTAFPYDAQALALVDRKRDALHRLHVAVGRIERDGKIGDVEHGLSHERETNSGAEDVHCR